MSQLYCHESQLRRIKAISLRLFHIMYFVSLTTTLITLFESNGIYFTLNFLKSNLTESVAAIAHVRQCNSRARVTRPYVILQDQEACKLSCSCLCQFVGSLDVMVRSVLHQTEPKLFPKLVVTRGLR